jgi:ADP-ribose pyrophosphatase
MTKEDKRTPIWHGRVFDFNVEETILPNGKNTITEVRRHPGSSAIVPLFEKESVILIREYRPAIRDFLWEIPAGTMLPGEEPLECAKRELREECGFVGKKFEKLGDILIAPGYSDERIYLFMAADLIPCEQNLDEDELLTTHVFPFGQAMGMIERGEIQDAMTIVGLTMAYPIWQRRKGF